MSDQAGSDRHPEKRALRAVLLSASAWSLAGHFLRQVLRLGSNLILTRILFPEAFGLMAIVAAFNLGLSMLSDVGITQSIVQNARGEERAFLDTAWTLQVIRGFALWVLACLFAWPLAGMYGEPELVKLVAVASISSIFAGLTSTSIHLWSRRFEQRRLATLELAAHTAGIVCTIGLALHWKSVMALAVGGLAGSLVKMIGSHLWSGGHRNRLAWDRSAARSIGNFGRWIFLSSLLGYFIDRGDRLILGGILAMGELGQYSIAALYSQTVVQINNLLAAQVLLPLYSRYGRVTDATLIERIKKIRLALMALCLPPLCLFVVAGDVFIDLLYDDRYLGAGWMLRVLSAGTIFTVLGQVGPIFLARGESKIGLIATGIRSLFLIGLMVVGGRLAGSVGVISAIALSHVVNYPLQVWISRRYEVWLPRFDLVGLGLCGVAIAVGLHIRGLSAIG